DFRGTQQRIERHHDRTGLENREVGEQKVRQVGQLDRDLVAAAHTEVAQTGGDPTRDVVDLGVAECLLGDVAKRLVWMCVAGFAEHDREVKAHQLLLDGWARRIRESAGEGDSAGVSGCGNSGRSTAGDRNGVHLARGWASRSATAQITAGLWP